MGQPLTQQVQQEPKKEETQAFIAFTDANFVQAGQPFFTEIDQMITYVDSFAFDRHEFVKRLKETQEQGYTLYQP